MTATRGRLTVYTGASFGPRSWNKKKVDAGSKLFGVVRRYLTNKMNYFCSYVNLMTTTCPSDRCFLFISPVFNVTSCVGIKFMVVIVQLRTN